jgi:hypothetical protein
MWADIGKFDLWSLRDWPAQPALRAQDDDAAFILTIGWGQT